MTFETTYDATTGLFNTHRTDAPNAPMRLMGKIPGDALARIDWRNRDHVRRIEGRLVFHALDVISGFAVRITKVKITWLTAKDFKD